MTPEYLTEIERHARLSGSHYLRDMLAELARLRARAAELEAETQAIKIDHQAEVRDLVTRLTSAMETIGEWENGERTAEDL